MNKLAKILGKIIGVYLGCCVTMVIFYVFALLITFPFGLTGIATEIATVFQLLYLLYLVVKEN